MACFYHVPASPSIISNSDLEDRIEVWRERAALFRDRHEKALIHGRSRHALVYDAVADEVERCVAGLEKLLSVS